MFWLHKQGGGPSLKVLPSAKSISNFLSLMTAGVQVLTAAQGAPRWAPLFP